MPNIQLFKPFYRTEEILELVRECCEEGWTGIGGKSIEFENAWKEYSGAITCHMLNSATAGLHLAILQLKKLHGWSDGDEVIVTPITFISSVHAILYNKLKPIFADIDCFGCLNPESVIKKITEKTKAILFVGLGGNVGQLEAIKHIADEKELIVILDAAHMSGTKWIDSRKQVGCSDEDCDVAIYSFQAVKNLPTADSGCLCWNTFDGQALDKETRQLAWLGIDKDTYSRTHSSGSYKWHYDVPEVGFKYHSNAISGAFGLVGLKYLDQDNAYRRNLCEIYTHYLNNNSKIEIVPTNDEYCISSRHLFQILVDNRDEVMLALNQVGVYCGVHYRINTDYKMYEYAKGSCPRAEEFSKKVISLPLHLYLTEKDVKYISDQLNLILK